jgi:hypothetical protein
MNIENVNNRLQTLRQEAALHNALCDVQARNRQSFFQPLYRVMFSVLNSSAKQQVILKH